MSDRDGPEKRSSCSWTSEIKDVPTVVTEIQGKPEDLRQSLPMKMDRKSSMPGWIASVKDIKGSL